MISQLLIGTIMISATIILHVAFVEAAIGGLTSLAGRLATPLSYVAKMSFLVASSLWLLASHSLGVWLWALMFITFGAIGGFEPAVYFSLVTFTTLGYGDITLDANWRILSALCAANGLLLFGITTAFLVELLRSLQGPEDVQEDST